MRRFEVFTAITRKNDVFWDANRCDSCKNRRCGGTYRLHVQDEKKLATANVVPSLLIPSLPDDGDDIPAKRRF
jgi:hypothetical protein